MMSIDQTTHFLRPVNFDVVADARVVRIGRNTRLRPRHAAQCRRPPVGMVASAYAVL
jgi:acyl-coenzyme A thioesterase PaaI-like protein